MSGNEHLKPDFEFDTDPSETHHVWTPCQTLHITVVRQVDNPEMIDYIKIKGSSSVNNCGESWLETCADDLTFMIRRIKNHGDAIAIVKNYIRHRCNKMIPNEKHINSCSDAIGRVIAEVLGVDINEAR